MDEILIEKILLKNGLFLKMFDCSRPVAGDRWQVIFKIRIDVILKPEYFSDVRLSDIAFENALSLLGDSTAYLFQKERNFIADKEKAGVLENMKTECLNTNIGYLSSSKFPIGLILGNFRKTHSQVILSEKQRKHEINSIFKTN